MTTNTLATLTDALRACQVAITQLEPSVAQTNALAHVQDALRLADQLQTQQAAQPSTPLQEIVAQLRLCNCECEAGALEQNAAWRELERMAQQQEGNQ